MYWVAVYLADHGAVPVGAEEDVVLINHDCYFYLQDLPKLQQCSVSGRKRSITLNSISTYGTDHHDELSGKASLPNRARTGVKLLCSCEIKHDNTTRAATARCRGKRQEALTVPWDKRKPEVWPKSILLQK